MSRTRRAVIVTLPVQCDLDEAGSFLHRNIAWVRERLDSLPVPVPFRDGAFDAVTISFGLRNIVDPEAGLRELLRVTRPGGRLVVCEFSHPTNPAFRTVYLEYLMKALPPMARAVSSAPAAYVYLAESIRAWPDQRGLADLIGEAGWTSPQWRNLSGGIVSLHRATGDADALARARACESSIEPQKRRASTKSSSAALRRPRRNRYAPRHMSELHA